MADFQVNTFTIPQDLLDLITTDLTQVTTQTVYDRTPPAGWMIVAKGPLGSVVVCAKPCNKVQLPPPQ